MREKEKIKMSTVYKIMIMWLKILYQISILWSVTILNKNILIFFIKNQIT